MTGNPGEDAFPNVATREAFGYLTTEPRTWVTVAATVAAMAAHPDGPEDAVTAHLAQALQALATEWPGYGEPVDWPHVAGLLLADLAGMEAQPAESSCSTH